MMTSWPSAIKVSCRFADRRPSSSGLRIAHHRVSPLPISRSAALNALFRHLGSFPTVRRVPADTFAEFVSDIGDLVQKFNFQGWKGLMRLAGKDARDCVRGRYVVDADVQVAMHDVLADYWSSRWAGDTEKPFQVPEEDAKKFGVPASGKLIRHVATQPLTFPTGVRNGVKVDGKMYNSRRVREQPHHLACSGRWKELVHSCLCSFEYTKVKLAALSVEELLHDFEGMPGETGKVAPPHFHCSAWPWSVPLIRTPSCKSSGSRSSTPPCR